MPGARRSEAWYRNGLRFQCTGCGACCRGAPGRVQVSDAEIAALAQRLELSDAEFRAMYTRRLRGAGISLRERQSGDCVFWSEERGCRVYSDRPRQCRSFPFWASILHSRERWQEEAESCPGMNTGPRRDAVWIRRTSRNDGTGGPPPEEA
jgi:Fe-S-cluster containining protein